MVQYLYIKKLNDSIVNPLKPPFFWVTVETDRKRRKIIKLLWKEYYYTYIQVTEYKERCLLNLLYISYFFFIVQIGKWVSMGDKRQINPSSHSYKGQTQRYTDTNVHIHVYISMYKK